MIPAVTEFTSGIFLNDGLWARVESYSRTAEAQSLTGAKKRFLEETLAEFYENGVNLSPEVKPRWQVVATELAQLTQQFSENVIDSTNDWELLVEDESRLAGLPPSARATAAADAVANGHEGKWRFTLKYPSRAPVLDYADDEELRREVWVGTSMIGAQKNPELIYKILKLRHEMATLAGHATFADYVLQRRMAKNGLAALTFVESLHDRIAEAFARETQELEEYRADKTGNARELLEPWSRSYWAEMRRQELYDFDEEVLRPYFPLDGVLAGMFHIVETLYDIRVSQPEERPEVWHDDVAYYQVHDADGKHLGSFYADWYPRDSKRGGAWMNPLRIGSQAPHAPHLGVICTNVTPPTDGEPSLLTHSEVVTIFHEFGHLLHHLLSETEMKTLSGIRVAWDFVELPSQLMENFCWERETLDLFARNHESGETIPDELADRLLSARNYRSATVTMIQLGAARLDLHLHIDAGNLAEDFDLNEYSDEILGGYFVPTETKSPSIASRFTHLFGSPIGYAAGYYSYKWAEVLDADAFTRFKMEGVLSPAVGHDFREAVLSRGNSDAADTLFERFMGRAPDLSAFLERNGLN